MEYSANGAREGIVSRHPIEPLQFPGAFKFPEDAAPAASRIGLLFRQQEIKR